MAEKFSRDDWLILGFAQLAAEGLEGLKLDALCAAAGRTRGSFYHHFADHDAYRAALWDHWREFCAIDVLDALDDAADGQGRWSLLARLSSGIDPTLEAAIRRAASSVEEARAAVAAVDAARIAHLAEIVAAQERCPPDLARDLAGVEYAVFVGRQQLFPGEAAEARIGGLVAEMISMAAQKAAAASA